MDFSPLNETEEYKKRVRSSRKDKKTYVHGDDKREEDRELLLNYWKLIGKLRNGEGGEEAELWAEEVMKEFKAWVKSQHKWGDGRLYMTEWARNALKLDFKLEYEEKQTQASTQEGGA